jgi:hypothetical protein
VHIDWCCHRHSCRSAERSFSLRLHAKPANVAWQTKDDTTSRRMHTLSRRTDHWVHREMATNERIHGLTVHVTARSVIDFSCDFIITFKNSLIETN